MTMLIDAIETFITHLQSKGYSTSRMIQAQTYLPLMIQHFGEEKEVSKLITPAVSKFFSSETILKTKTGKERNEKTVKLIRLFTRQFLVFAYEQGMTERLPLPAEEKAVYEKHLRAAQRQAEKEQRREERKAEREAKEAEKAEKEAKRATKNSVEEDDDPLANMPDNDDELINDDTDDKIAVIEMETEGYTEYTEA